MDQLHKYQHVFFIGVAGAGMSALAQYLRGTGMKVSGSDRFFNEGKAGDIKEKLMALGIECFLQDGSGFAQDVDLVIASTAIEDTVSEIKKARQMNIPVMRRSELLALICAGKKTIAVGGTSGKSTTAAMLFHILMHAGLDPSIITGAGLVSLIRQGKIGNAYVGGSEWLIIEADESDGSIVQYHPEIGLLLNVEKDHKEVHELMDIFGRFRQNSRQFIVNQSNPHARQLSTNIQNDFETDEPGRGAGFGVKAFVQKGFNTTFEINGQPFLLHLAGKHNMEDAVAAATAAAQAGVPLKLSAAALQHYEGIYRRAQVLGQKNGVWVVDDFAHNPVKCAAAIRSCQPVATKLVAWLQPHGYIPTKFLRKDFVKEISQALRPQDQIWMSEIFYAGGTTTKDISAADLVNDIKANGKNAFFVEDRNRLTEALRPHLAPGTVLLMMGARDPSLESFVKKLFREL